MSDDIQEQTVEETVEKTNTEATEQPQQATEEASGTEQESNPEPKRKDAAHNFAELRKKEEAAQRRADEAERRANELFELLKSSKTAQTTEERDIIEEELSKLSKDDLVTVDHVDKKITKYNKSASKEVQELKRQVQELKSAQEEVRFRTKYPDLDEVLSQENIEALRKDDPDMADSISSLPTGSKEQVVLAYKVIKGRMPPKREESIDKKVALSNSKKPLSVQALKNSSPMAMANVFETMNPSKEQKQAIWKQMQQDMKGG